MDRFLSIEAVVRVAQAQSFAEAARQLRLSKSVLTTRVQQLEELLGTPLFHRTTRTVRMSETGQAFYRDCLELVTRTNDVIDQMRGTQASPAMGVPSYLVSVWPRYKRRTSWMGRACM